MSTTTDNMTKTVATRVIDHELSDIGFDIQRLLREIKDSGDSYAGDPGDQIFQVTLEDLNRLNDQARRVITFDIALADAVRESRQDDIIRLVFGPEGSEEVWGVDYRPVELTD